MGGIKRRSPHVMHSLQFNDYGLNHREMDAGFPIDMSKVGAIPAAAIYVGKHMPVRIVNASGAPMYVATGDDTVTAPTGMSNGIAILDLTEVTINTGDQEYIRFNAASASAQYAIIKDDGLYES